MKEPNPFFQALALSEVVFRVRDMPAMIAFYRDILGFKIVNQTGQQTSLSPNGLLPELLVLNHAPAAPLRPPGSSGLFHIAMLYPDRPALGRIARRLLQENIRFATGDHGVSEALYLDDPEGNGVELYADRPVEFWPKPTSPEDAVGMYTKAVNLASLLQAGESLSGPMMPPTTRIGHIHLSVVDLAQTERFYTQLLRFDLMVRTFPGALFFGRGGYHHHVGTNVWQSRLPAPLDALGLARFTLRFSDRRDFASAVSLAEAKNELAHSVRDPSGIEIVLTGLS